MKYALYLLCAAMLVLSILIFLYPKEEIIRVELARSGAWLDRGAAISVDKSLRYNFYYNYRGKDGVPMSGYYIGKVTRQFWDTLQTKLDAIDLKNITATDNLGASDISYFELIVTWKTSKRRFVRMRSFGERDSHGNFIKHTDPLPDFIEWLDSSYKKVPFIKESKEPLKFETTYQNGGLEADEQKYFEEQKNKAIKTNSK